MKPLAKHPTKISKLNSGLFYEYKSINFALALSECYLCQISY